MKVAEPRLRLDRAYEAKVAAKMLGMNVRVFNERVREGWVSPINNVGERRFSGYALAKKLGWPLTDDPRDYMPSAQVPAAMRYPGLKDDAFQPTRSR